MFQALCWPFWLLNLPDHPRRYVISLFWLWQRQIWRFVKLRYVVKITVLEWCLRFLLLLLSHWVAFNCRFTSWTAACQVSSSFTISQVHWVGDVIQHLPPSLLPLIFLLAASQSSLLTTTASLLIQPSDGSHLGQWRTRGTRILHGN